MERWMSVLGLFVMIGLAWLLSERKDKQNLRLIVSGVSLQFLLGVVILLTRPGKAVFAAAHHLINRITACADAGAGFVFGPELVNPENTIFAFRVLPIIIFMASLMAILFHLGIIQIVVKVMAKIMVWVMDVSGVEALCAAANVFFGHTEAPLVVRPYIKTMTRSEIMALMTSGMATIAGSVLAAYVSFGISAGHLLSASLMSAPAALVIAKIMVPETEQSLTKGAVKVQPKKEDENVLDAACRGAGQGLRLALNVAAMLVAFIALVALVDSGLGLLPDIYGKPLSLDRILGFFLAPLAWVMGIPWQDAPAVGALLGQKTILNEFIAYLSLVDMRDQISDRSFTIATYALCGFANLGSVAIMIGGVGELVHDRRKEFARLSFRAMIGGTLAGFMTACIAGMLIG